MTYLLFLFWVWGISLLRPHAPEFRGRLGSSIGVGLEENKTGHKPWYRSHFHEGNASDGNH